MDLVNQINQLVTEEIDLNQLNNKMLITIKVSRPCVILKDRPYFDKYLQADLEEITITTREQMESGRFHKYPKKLTLTSTFIIAAKEINLEY